MHRVYRRTPKKEFLCECEEFQNQWTLATEVLPCGVVELTSLFFFSSVFPKLLSKFCLRALSPASCSDCSVGEFCAIGDECHSCAPPQNHCMCNTWVSPLLGCPYFFFVMPRDSRRGFHVCQDWKNATPLRNQSLYAHVRRHVAQIILC